MSNTLYLSTSKISQALNAYHKVCCPAKNLYDIFSRIYQHDKCHICKTKFTFSTDPTEQTNNPFIIYASKMAPWFNICKDCYFRLSEPLETDEMITCDAHLWGMFNRERCKTKFNSSQTWYWNEQSSEHLCPEHGRQLMECKDPAQDKWKQVFKPTHFGDTIYRLDSTMELYDGDDRNPLLKTRSDKIDISVPDNLTELIISISEFINSDNFEEDVNSSTLDSIWDSLVSVNEHKRTSLGDHTYFYQDCLSCIQDWIPFDHFKGGKFADLGFALVNCNPSSPYYKQVATIILDDHFRAAFNTTENWDGNQGPLMINEYLKERAAFESGKYDLTKINDRAFSESDKVPTFIEYVRWKLEQRFCYG